MVVSGVTLSRIVVISKYVKEIGMPPDQGVGMIAVVMPLISFGLRKLWVFSQ